MQRINVSIRPSSGFVFSDTDGSSHRGPSWAAVIQRVRDYRARKGLQPGDVEAEVMAQSCKRYPSLCREPNATPTAAVPAPQPPQIRPPPSLKARVLAWMANLFNAKVRGHVIPYVSNEEAVTRATICRTCPQNRPFITAGCSSCKTITENYRDSLIPNRARLPGLGGCELLSFDITSAVYFDEVRVDNPSLPAYCWRRTAI